MLTYLLMKCSFTQNVTLKYLINEYTRLDNATLFPPSPHFFSHTRLFSCQNIFHILLLDHTCLRNLEKLRKIVKPTEQFLSNCLVILKIPVHWLLWSFIVRAKKLIDFFTLISTFKGFLLVIKNSLRVFFILIHCIPPDALCNSTTNAKVKVFLSLFIIYLTIFQDTRLLGHTRLLKLWNFLSYSFIMLYSFSISWDFPLYSFISYTRLLDTWE